MNNNLFFCNFGTFGCFIFPADSILIGKGTTLNMRNFTKELNSKRSEIGTCWSIARRAYYPTDGEYHEEYPHNCYPKCKA